MRSRPRAATLGLVTAAAIVGGVLMAPAALAAPTTTVVAAPQGSGDDCTEAAPCDLGTAQQHARTASAGGSAVDVLLRGGTYTLSQTLTFDASDSGAEDAPVTYQAFGSETPVLSSAAPLTGWQDTGGGIWSAPTGGLDFRQLYVEGTRATPARWPNVNSNVQLQGSDRSGKTLSILTSQYQTFAGADLSQIDMVMQLQWGETYARLASATSAGTMTKLTLQDEEANILFQRPYPLLSDGSPIYFENALAFLDTPGEFFVDRKADRVYYMPRPGESASSSFQVPTLDTLVDVAGTKSAPVHDLRFVGLTFADTGWNRPTEHGYLNAQGGLYNLSANLQNQQYTDRPPAGFHASWADRIAVAGSTFQRMGSTALDLDTAVHDSQAIGNVIRDVSGNGVMVGKFTDPDVEYHTPYQPTDPDEVTARVTIANNVITRVGQVYMGTAAVNGGYIRESSIVHNDISDAPWAGITTGWGWTSQQTAQGDNQISFNRIGNAVNQLCDTAAIYHLSNDPGTVFEGNYLHDIVRTPAACGSAVAGFYLDEGTDNTVLRNNVLADTDGWLNFNATGPNNDITNTVSSGKGIIQAAGLEPDFQYLLSQVNLAVGQPTTSSSASSSAENAVDGDYTDGWSSASGDTSAWWQVDLGQSVSLAQISLTMRQDADQPATRQNFELRGSNDPSFATYTVLDKRNDRVVADAGTYTAGLSDHGQYRYVRVVKTDGAALFLTEFSAQPAGGVASTPAVPTFDTSTPWRLTNVNSGLVAAIDGSATGNGGALVQATATGATNQQWYLRPATGNLFTIVNVNSGRALDNYQSASRGSRVFQWDANGQSNQLWSIEAQGSAFILRNAYSGQVLDVGGNSTASGAAVDQWMSLAQPNQAWTFTPVNAAPITATTSAAPNAAGWNNTPVDVTFSTTAQGVTIQSRPVGTATWSTTQPVNVAAQGTTQLEYRGLRSGSVAAGSQGQLTVKLDSVAPATSASSDPASGTAPAGQTVTAHFTAADATSGVAYTEYSSDNGTTWTRDTGAGAAFTASGTHAVLYRSADVAGNVEAAKSITLTVAAPQNVARVTITSSDSPTADGWYQQDVLVALAAPQSGQKVQYSVNGGAWRTYSSSIRVSANGTTTIDHRLLSNNVVVSGSAAQVQVKVDKTAPTASATRTPVSGQGTPRNPVSVVFTGSDTLSGVARVEYRINSGAWTTNSGTPVAFGTQGDYVVSYRSVDKAGNVAATKTVSFSIVADPATSVRAGSTTVRPGDAVTLSLAGYTRWDDVTITIGGTTVATVLTDQNGAARVTVRVPADAAAGSTAVVATGTNGLTAQTAVTIRK